MELAEPGAPRSLCPHCRAWPWDLLRRAGAGKGHPWVCLVAARRRPCALEGACVPSRRQPLGCWAPRESQPPRWWEQEGAIVWGFNIQNGKKCEKVVQYFSCRGYYSTQNKNKHQVRSPASGPAPGLETGAVAPVGFVERLF